MDKFFVDALEFLAGKKEFGMKDFSKRRYLQNLIRHNTSPREQQRLTLELQELTDEGLNEATQGPAGQESRS